MELPLVFSVLIKWLDEPYVPTVILNMVLKTSSLSNFEFSVSFNTLSEPSVVAL